MSFSAVLSAEESANLVSKNSCILGPGIIAVWNISCQFHSFLVSFN